MSTRDNRSHERRFVRTAVNFPVTIIVPGGELVLNGTSVDLSRGGMRVATSTDLPAGQPIVLRFTLPGGDREMLVRAKIVLTFYEAASKSYAHGVAFTQYTSGDHEKIGAYVASLQPAQ